MGIKEFIKSVKIVLGIKKSVDSKKKKSIKKLLKKLKKRRLEIYRLLKNSSKKDKLLLNEELKIVSLHIKKGKILFNHKDT